MRVLRIAAFVLAIGISQHVLAAAFSFVPGHYYMTSGVYHDPQIDEYDESGKLVAFLYLPEFKDFASLSFGPDQRLYVSARSGDYREDIFSILAINAQGAIEQRYASPDGNFFGQLAFDGVGNFYQGRSRFEISGSDSGSVFLPHGDYGITTLPNGNFVAADELAVYELDPSGNTIRKVFDAQSLDATLIKKVVYDAESNSIFTHMVGGGYHILRIDFATGDVLQSAAFISGTDLFLTQEGSLLSGAYLGGSKLLNRNLETEKVFSSEWQYGTQFVPEPSAFVLAGIGVAALCAFTRTARGSGSSQQSRRFSRRRWRLRCR
jgi:hypothetical protein